MKFEKSSLNLLSITKAKAKMYEFGLDEDHHLKLTSSPSQLLLMTIGMLGDLCRTELSGDINKEALTKTQSELRNVAKYFDALIETKLQFKHEYYLGLLGASAYYLANMPGSSSVLSQQLDYGSRQTPYTDSGLEFFLEWLLKGDIKTQVTVIDSPYIASITSIIKTLGDFYELSMNSANIMKQLIEEFRLLCHNHGTDRELLFADIICTILLRKISNSPITLLPKYTNLNLDLWLPALKKDRFIKEFWPAQKLLGEQGVFSGNSAVIQLPTSAGKTKSAEIIIRSSFLSGRAKVAVIIAPFRSLCREISDTLSESFSNENILVNQLNDVPQIDNFDLQLFSMLLEEVDTTPSIIVSTPEKLVYLLRHKPELANEISLAIYDEGHQFDSGSRGVTYELLLTSLKQKLKPETQHVLISAVISNAESIGSWLYSRDGVSVNGSDVLATERSVAFSSWNSERGQLRYVEPLQPNIEEFFVPRILEITKIPMRNRERTQKYFPNKKEKTSIAAYLGLKLSEYGPVAVFCGTKVSVSKICKDILKAVDRIEDLFVPLNISSKDEIEKIASLSAIHLGKENHLTKAIRLGVLPHSGNVPNGLRISVEYAMENGLGCCVICTSTLAQGVNLPIKYLIISGVFQGEKRISTRDFHNLLGRAGRSGKHTEGSIIFTDTELYDKRKSTQSWHWGKMKELLDPSQSEHCTSSLLYLAKPFEDVPYNIDPIRFAAAPNEHIKFVIENGKEPYRSILLNQMEQRKGFLKSVESYLLANSSDVESTNESIFMLYSNTLAYSLANIDEKERLRVIFEIATESINSVSPEKRSVFGKALLGMEELLKIDKWIDESFDKMSENFSNEQWLRFLWNIVTDVAKNKVLSNLEGEGSGIYFAEQWLAGKSYIDILNQVNALKYKYRAGNQLRDIKIDHVLNICDSSLSYDLMLVIGAIADLMESRECLQLHAEQVRNLQLSMKLGLSSNVEHWLYSKGLADREICKHLGIFIVSMGYEGVLKDSFFEEHRDDLEPELKKFPSVFWESVY